LNFINLDEVIYRFTNGNASGRTDAFTIRQACEGVLVFSGIGSGKTSVSGAALAKAYLRPGSATWCFPPRKTSCPPGSDTPKKPGAPTAF